MLAARLTLFAVLFPCMAEGAPIGFQPLQDRGDSDHVTPFAESLTVDPSGSGDHRTIGAAVAAARPGAQIKIAPGTYRERFRIEKPVTLVGAGSDRTHIVGPERDRAPVIEVGPTALGSVSLIELAVTLEGEGELGSVGDWAALELEGAHVELRRVAVVGSPACGIRVVGGRVEMDSILVAGAWATGIAVVQEAESEGEIGLRDSEVRNCHHRCVTVKGRADRVRIEGCLISSSSWHGIRYDDASPTIVRNVFFDNMRSGIYNAGDTGAIVEDNLFVGTGISGWKRGTDRIQGNTFVVPSEHTPFTEWRYSHNQFGDLGSGIKQNLFVKDVAWDHPARARSLLVNPPGGKGAANGPLAWDDRGRVLVTTGAEETAPGFDHAVVEVVEGLPQVNGCAAGASGPHPLTSRWPELRPEERLVASICRDQLLESRSQVAESELRWAAMNEAKEWMEAIQQAEDTKQRDAALQSVREALEGNDRAARFAALLALRATSGVELDRRSLAPHARRIARVERGAERLYAFYALDICGREPADLELLLESLRERPDHELERAAVGLLSSYSDGALVGAIGEMALEILKQAPPRRTSPVRYLSGARLSDTLEAWLFAQYEGGSGRTRRDALLAMSTLRDKSPSVVDELMKATRDVNSGAVSWALDGLTSEVGEESRTRVASFLIACCQNRELSDSWGCAQALQGVQRYGTAQHLDALQALATDPSFPAEGRAAAAMAVEEIRGRM